MTFPRTNSTPVPGRAPDDEPTLPLNLDGLAQAARLVAGEHAALNAAIDEEHQAAAVLLARLVEVVRPALPALSSLVEIDDREFRGVLIAGSGRVDDTGLYLLVGGGEFLVAGEEGWVLLAAPLAVARAGWSVEEIAESLAKALASHQGKRGKATARGAERAQKLRALADLLGGGK